MKKTNVIKLATIALIAGGSLAGAAGEDQGLGFTQIATNGVAVIGAAGAAGAALILAGNGLKIAVKWAKRMVGMA